MTPLASFGGPVLVPETSTRLRLEEERGEKTDLGFPHPFSLRANSVLAPPLVANKSRAALPALGGPGNHVQPLVLNPLSSGCSQQEANTLS